MPIDASIYNLLAQPRKSAFDYAAEYEQQDANRLAQQQARQLNALQIGAAQDQANDRSRLRFEQEGLRTAITGLPAGATMQDRINAARGLGTQTGLSQADAWAKADLEQRRGDAEIAKNKAATDKDNFDLGLKRTKATLMTAITGRSADQIRSMVMKGVQDKVWSQDEADTILSDLPTDGDPAKLMQWRGQAAMHAMELQDFIAEQHRKTQEAQTAATNAATNANRDLIPDGKGGWKVNQPLIDAKARIAQAGAPVTMGAPMAAIDTRTGLPVLVQTGNRPGAAPQIVPGVAPKPEKPEPMSGTLQKELVEADDIAQNSRNVAASLRKAAELNDKAYSGYAATPRAKLRSNLPGESDAANATIELENIIGGQGLESLRAIFGGNPTEGERRILLDLQASTDKTPAQRKAIIDRAVAAAEKRGKVAEARAKAIREGTYLTQGAAPVQEAPKGGSPAAPAAPKPGDVVQGYRFKGGNPADKANWEKQ